MRILSRLLFAAPFVLGGVGKENLYPRVKLTNDFSPPFNFRNTEGLGPIPLHASGSGQPSEKGLEYLVSFYSNRKLVVIDLRREFHIYVNGLPVSWKKNEDSSYCYNTALSSEKIEKREKALVEEISGKEDFPCRSEEGEATLIPQKVATERSLVEEKGLFYIRLPVSDNHRPKDAEVDAFIEIIRSLPHNSQVHFHCAAGEGRTTTFLCMLDMMRNSKTVSAEEILKRQEKIGGANLNLHEHQNRPPIAQEWAKERLEFLLLFHQYCKKNPPLIWSEWKSLLD